MEQLNNIDISNCIGQMCKSRSYGDFIITNYKNSREIEIKFTETNYTTTYSQDKIRTGNVKDYYAPSVFNVGVIGTKYQKTFIDIFGKKKNKREYSVWSNMIQRCYDSEKQIKHPTYKDCLVSENFKSYEYFYEWCNKQVGFNNGWDLDKDLLFKGNKIYSEDTCVFIPRELNNLLTKGDVKRGRLPIGVCKFSKNRFSASLNINHGKSERLGLFETPEEAFLVYKKAKEDFIKEQALKWKDQIDPRAFEALINYNVEITD